MAERGLPAPKPPTKQKPMKTKVTDQTKETLNGQILHWSQQR